MAVRKWYIDEALHSFSRLLVVLASMTEEEVLAALALESSARRRPTVMSRLISRAARLNELNYVSELKGKYGYATKLHTHASRKKRGPPKA